jgi:phage terminase large subunit GpA-like protein
MNPLVESLWREVSALLAPPRQITVSEWAAENLYLSSEYSSQPGRITPFAFQREPMDTFSDPCVLQTVIKGAVQILKTVCNQAAIAWSIDVDPGPTLVVNEREEDAEAFGKERVDPMIRDSPRLRGKVKESGTRKSKNTLREKWFPGGMLAITFAGKAGNLARRSIRYLVCEEEDKWPLSASGRGDPFAMAWARTDTFKGKRKAIRSSSPSRVGSPIDKAYEASDQRQWFAVCPYCQHAQSLMEKFFTRVRYDESLPTVEEQAATALYHCESCDRGWDDLTRRAAVEAGEWRASRRFAGIAGFWISSLYSPWVDLQDVVLEYLKKKDQPMELMQFTNERLAENWVEAGESVQWEALLKRCEEYPVGVVPRGGLFVTCGADVQWDRIEGEKVAWGRDRENWSVDYRIFEGDTADDEVWLRFWSWVYDPVPTEGGSLMPTSRCFVDAGDGSRSAVVYDQVRRQPSGIVVAIKGTTRGLLPVSQPSAVDVTVAGRKIRGGLKIKLVLVDFFKSELYADFPKEMALDGKRPKGLCHWPKGQYYGEEHFKQVCAEQLVTWQEKRTGRVRREWRKKRSRNEALDCRVYARAAAYDVGMDRFQPHHWAQLEALLQGELFGFAAQAPVTPAGPDAASLPERRAESSAPAVPQSPALPSVLAAIAPRRPRVMVRLA